VLGTVGWPLTCCPLGLLKPNQTPHSSSTSVDQTQPICCSMSMVLSSQPRRQPFLGGSSSALQREFAMKDLGELHHFLNMHVQRRGDGLLLSK